MFEPNRRFQRCILCEGGDLTKEHVFGKALAAYLAVKEHWTARPSSASRANRNRVKKGSSPITAIAPRLLCKNCNNSRLSPNMSASLPILIALCEGADISFDETQYTILRRYFERFALIVDVCTSAEQATDRYRQTEGYQLNSRYRQDRAIIDANTRNNWLKGERLDSVDVWLGRHQGVLGLNPEMNIAHLAVKMEGLGTINYVKRISVVMRQLAFSIDINGRFGDIPSSFSRLAVNFNWKNGSVSYDDFYSLRHQDSEIAHLRKMFGMPMVRAEIEALSWQEGRLTFPPYLKM